MKNNFALTLTCSNQNDSDFQSFKNQLDNTVCPMIFGDLDSAKAWVNDFVWGVIIPDVDNTNINPDFLSDDGDMISIFGSGSGALIPWQTVVNDDGVRFNFWIHLINIH